MSVPGDAVIPEDIENLSEEQLDQLFDEQANVPEPQPDEPPDEQSPATPIAEEPQAGGEPEKTDSEPEKDKPEEQKTVPLAALHEERARRKEAIEEKKRMEKRFEQVMDKLSAQNEPPAPAEEPPTVTPLEENPIGHFDDRIAQVEAETAANKKAREEAAQNQERADQWNRVMAAYNQDAARLAQEDPNFNEAYQYWGNSRMNELVAGGATREQAQNIVYQEESAAVVRAMQDGESPAERVYAIAKARGYKPAEAPAGGQPPAEPGPDLEKIAAGQNNAQGTPGGGTEPTPMTLEALAQMSDDEFDANWDRIVGSNG